MYPFPSSYCEGIPDVDYLCYIVVVLCAIVLFSGNCRGHIIEIIWMHMGDNILYWLGDITMLILLLVLAWLILAFIPTLYSIGLFVALRTMLL